MTSFDWPGHLSATRPEAFALFVADIARTNLSYPCELRLNYAEQTVSHTFETREAVEALALALSTEGP